MEALCLRGMCQQCVLGDCNRSIVLEGNAVLVGVKCNRSVVLEQCVLEGVKCNGSIVLEGNVPAV